MVGWPACRLGPHPRETQLIQIESLDENIDHSNRILPGYVIFQATG
jgi:hypothetical protein